MERNIAEGEDMGLTHYLKKYIKVENKAYKSWTFSIDWIINVV